MHLVAKNTKKAAKIRIKIFRFVPNLTLSNEIKQTVNNMQQNSAFNAIFIGLAAFIGYSLIRKGVAAGQLLWYADGIHRLQFDGATPVLTIRVRVMNTSNQRYTINAFAADVKANNTVIGNASFFTPQTIEANNQAVLLINIRLMPLSLVNDLVSAFQTKNFRFKIDVDGTANVDQLQYPVNLSYNVGF